MHKNLSQINKTLQMGDDVGLSGDSYLRSQMTMNTRPL